MRLGVKQSEVYPGIFVFESLFDICQCSQCLCHPALGYDGVIFENDRVRSIRCLTGIQCINIVTKVEVSKGS